MIDFFNAKTFIGKKIKLKFTKESLEKSEKNKEIIEENNEWLDKVLKKINFFKRHGLSSQKDVDFSTGVVTSVGKDFDYEENDDGKEFYYIELDSYKWINLKDRRNNWNRKDFLENFKNLFLIIKLEMFRK